MNGKKEKICKYALDSFVSNITTDIIRLFGNSVITTAPMTRLFPRLSNKARGKIDEFTMGSARKHRPLGRGN